MFLQFEINSAGLLHGQKMKLVNMKFKISLDDDNYNQSKEQMLMITQMGCRSSWL